MLLTRPEGTEPADLHVSRRSFAALLAAGYAALGAAAEAAPITTPADGLVIETPTIPGSVPAYVARPSTPGRHPVVIVVNEIFGVHEYIKDICRRLAKLGYVAVAPEFFFRADPGRTLATLTDRTAMKAINDAATYDQVMQDVGATLTWLKRQRFARPDHAGITGFCWGGNVVWMAAARFPQLKAGVAWYGRLAKPKDSTEVRKWPLEIAGEMKVPVLGLYGGQDKGIPVADVDAMRAALKAAGKPGYELVVYPQAEHGFHADYRPSYNPAAAEDGWTRMLSHFRAHGVG